MKPKEKIIYHYQKEVKGLPEHKVNNWILQLINAHQLAIEELQIIFCSDVELLEINREYLQHDYYTDIISFPYQSEPIIADLYISIDRVKENAEEFGVLFMNELLRVIIHGVFHLIGFADHDEISKNKMRQLEDEALILYGVIE